MSNIGFGQFAIIDDKDGSCNIRSSAQKKNNIIDTLENGHLVYCSEFKGNWVNIDYTKNETESEGEIYKDRLKNISDYQTISISASDENKATLIRDSIKIIITSQSFDRKKYKLTFDKENKTQLAYINNKRYWGTDGEIPTTKYKSIEIYIGTKKMILPKIALANLFEISFGRISANYDKLTNTIYIQSMNSDGAGAYEVIWKIENGIYKDRLVAYGF